MKTDPKALTAEQIMEIGREFALSSRWPSDFIDFARAIERATREQTASTEAPYGRVTTHKLTGQQFFYRWPEPPYLDNASECITLYAAPVEQAGSPEAVTFKNAVEVGGRMVDVTFASQQAGSTPDETLREALAELLLLKRTMDRPANGVCAPTIEHVVLMSKRFNERFPIVLEAARRALATPTKLARTAQPEDFRHEPGEPFPTKPEMQSVHPAAVSGKEEKLFALEDAAEAHYFESDFQPQLYTKDEVFVAGARFAYQWLHSEAPAERDSEGLSLLPVDPGQDEQGKGESQ